MALKKVELESGCFSRVADDEFVFVLRAKDLLAPRVVRYWAERAANRGVDPRKVEEALKIALNMEWWQEEHGSHLPD